MTGGGRGGYRSVTRNAPVELGKEQNIVGCRSLVASDCEGSVVLPLLPRPDGDETQLLRSPSRDRDE